MTFTESTIAEILHQIHQQEARYGSDRRFVTYEVFIAEPLGTLAEVLALDPEPMLDAPCFHRHEIRVLYDRKTRSLLEIVDLCCKPEAIIRLLG